MPATGSLAVDLIESLTAIGSTRSHPPEIVPDHEPGDERRGDADRVRTATRRARPTRAGPPRGRAAILARPSARSKGARSRSGDVRLDGGAGVGPGRWNGLWCHLGRSSAGAGRHARLDARVPAMQNVGCGGPPDTGTRESAFLARRRGHAARVSAPSGRRSGAGQTLEKLGFDPQVLGAQIDQIGGDRGGKARRVGRDRPASAAIQGRGRSPDALPIGLGTADRPGAADSGAGTTRSALHRGTRHDRARLARCRGQELVALIAAEFETFARQETPPFVVRSATAHRVDAMPTVTWFQITQPCRRLSTRQRASSRFIPSSKPTIDPVVRVHHRGGLTSRAGLSQ